MTTTARFFTALAKGFIKLTCDITDEGLYKIPEKGPLMVVFNHINFLEVPILRIGVMPKEVFALTKKETWDNPIFRILADNWGGIPIDRENPAVSTFREAEKLMRNEKVLFIAPEGTRSGTGQLAKGNPGITSIAMRTGCTILPIAHYGGEDFWTNIKRLKRTKITIKAGNMLKIKPGVKANKTSRQLITEQIMHELAALLPEKYRGAYVSGPDQSLEQLLIPVD